ncbi:MAG: LegC family aminotransferase [Brevundimonas sp.]|uniref:LegC family aminotransferase n=1 Tax=Brevundimonas sp. TaxID=1871086 RepID=UPI0026228E31|nr:LegC family aminotransferase [Brevundimonas sp.]MDI6624853.1 LegC family aminotransferase [Brevundimonas sp.]MDQ7812385.1 LegC family aminotransferase [Brevundimonas sp.]
MSGDLPERILAAVQAALPDAVLPAPLHAPEFRGREWDYVKDCLDTGWVSSVGAYVDRIERDLEAITGVGHAVAVSNGTAALDVCFRLAGVEPGDEVLTPTLTFVATANAITYRGGTPHFVDSEARTLGVDPARLEEHLRTVAKVEGGVCVNTRTGRPIRALVIMHVFGHPSDVEGLAEVAARWNLVLVEDAAEALGSRWKGRHLGGFGRLAALSFNGNKIVTTGGGGAVLTDDPELAKRAKHLTTTAKVPHRWAFEHDEIGWNYRMPNLNAALGCAQLERLPEMLARKAELAARYGRAFEGVEGVRLLRPREDSEVNHWLNALILDRPDREARDRLLETLNDAGYQARPLWTLMHRLPMYADRPRDHLPTAEALEDRVVCLPSSAALADR